ncbi:MAG: adenylate kinase [Planctomycetes bacterium]|nr:adenylate kinase [Planctomycetota bacterium]
MRIVLLGAPGAGKGTQAKRLAETFDMLHLSSGDIHRAEKASGSTLGKTLARYMDAGQLVPDDVVVDVMAKAISDPKASRGLLLDGFPRTEPQAQALDAQLAELGAPLDKVAVIDVSAEAVVERICGRRSCPKCGAIYHLKFLKPAVEGVCDKCGYKGQFVQRADDTEAVVRQRLEAYRAQTAPLIDYYKKTSPDKVMVFDGNKAPDDVTRDMVAVLNKA